MLTETRINKGREGKIQERLKLLIKESNDLQNNYTPPEICDMMLDKLDLTGNKTILVLYTAEILFALRKLKYKGQVTFFTQSPKKRELATKLLPGVIVEYIDIEEDPLEFMENNWPEKFDIIVANPPYNKSLHLKFLEKSVNLSNERVLFVHPASYIVETKGKYRPFSDARELIKPILEDLTIFNGNGVFGIGLLVPCAIISLNKNNKEDYFKLNNLLLAKNNQVKKEHLDKISMFGFESIWNSFMGKVNSIKGSNLHDESSWGKEYKPPTKYFVETARIQGGTKRGNAIKIPITAFMQNDDFFTILRKSTDVKISKQPKYDIWWEFDTEKEAKSFIEFCKTDFVRACLATKKFAQSIYAGELKSIPYLDFTKEWTDEKLYKHFNITEEEQTFIKEIIPPYYD